MHSHTKKPNIDPKSISLEYSLWITRKLEIDYVVTFKEVSVIQWLRNVKNEFFRFFCCCRKNPAISAFYFSNFWGKLMSFQYIDIWKDF